MILVEIVPNLWIGDFDGVKYKDNINIKYLVNCSKDLHYLGNHSEYKNQMKQSIEQYEIIKMYEYLVESVEFIYKNMLRDDSTLVFCENGNQKSASVVAAFLMKYGSHSKDTAIKSIRTKYNSAFYPDINYNLSLDMFGKNI
jgi:protein-tyrosine phosphatase